MTKAKTRNVMLDGRAEWRPFNFPWAYELWEKHEDIRWLPKEVVFESDIRDWKHRLSPQEKNLVSQLLRFFTQADIQVQAGYAGLFLPAFYKVPELNLIMSSIAAREAIHCVSYSQVLDTIGMPDTEFSAFHDYQEMQEKYDFVNTFNGDNPHELARACAMYGAFVEGIQLFSSFAMLMNFGRTGRMNGMVDIVSWSQRDEGIHCQTLINCYHELVKRYPDEINNQTIKQELKEVCQKVVEMEEKFIDLAFEMGDLDNLAKADMKQYVRFLADYRLDQLGILPYYNVKANPLPWIDKLVNGKEHANFFERRSTEYGKGDIQGSDDDVDWNFD